MVVIIAIATISVNRFLLNTPADSAIDATITSVEPRAFMALASASDSRPVRRPSLPPTKAPANFPALAMTISPIASSSSSGSLSMVRSALSPDSPKNTGMNSAAIRPRSCSSMCRVRIGDSPISTPATKAPSTVCTPIR